MTRSQLVAEKKFIKTLLSAFEVQCSVGASRGAPAERKFVMREFYQRYKKVKALLLGGSLGGSRGLNNSLSLSRGFNDSMSLSRSVSSSSVMSTSLLGSTLRKVRLAPDRHAPKHLLLHACAARWRL
jgi:hypothetical protein